MSCRFCLSESKFQIPIFGEIGRELGVHFKIKSCFPSLNVIKEDGLPEIICYKCLYLLEKTFDFWSQCCTSEAILKSKRAGSNFSVKHGLQLAHVKNSKYKALTSFLESDSSDDDWCWDATYKISQVQSKVSKKTPHNKPREIRMESIVTQDISTPKALKRKPTYEYDGKDMCDIIDEDFYVKNNFDAPVVKEVENSGRFHSGTKNFSSNFWNNNSSHSKETQLQTNSTSQLHLQGQRPIQSHAEITKTAVMIYTKPSYNNSEFLQNVNTYSKNSSSRFNFSVRDVEQSENNKCSSFFLPEYNKATTKGRQDHTPMKVFPHNDTTPQLEGTTKYNNDLLANTRNILAHFRAYNSSN